MVLFGQQIFYLGVKYQSKLENLFTCYKSIPRNDVHSLDRDCVDYFLPGYQQSVESLKSVLLTTALVDRLISVERAVHLSRLETEFQVGYMKHNV